MIDGYDKSHPETLLDAIAKEVIENNQSVNGFNNAYYEYYMELIRRTNFLPHSSFVKQRFWHLYNKTSLTPECAMPDCYNRVRWHRDKDTHNECCSKKCSNTLYWIRKKEKVKKIEVSEVA